MSKKPHAISSPKIALACDWLTTPGGAEKVLLELHHMYPDAPIYTSQYSKKGISWFDNATVKTGWLQIFPSFLRKFLGPLRQIYFSHLDLSSYDVVISVTGAEAKSICTQSKPSATRPGRAAYHLCYCHVPTQYYWQMYDKYVDNPGFGIFDPIVRLCFKLLVKPLRKADYRAAQRPDRFITISTYAQQQIQQYYDRESTIIPPNVDITKFRPQVFHNFSTRNPQKNNNLSTTYPQNSNKFSTTFPQPDPEFSTEKSDLALKNDRQSLSSQKPADQFSPGNYFIISCRQVTWKRVDLAIQACKKLKLPLLVVGDGSEHHNLVKLANNSPYIKFLPWTNPDELATHLQNAKAYLFPSLEPFGIAAVEALAAGCPVITFADGGSRDIVIPGKNGLLFNEQTPDSLASAIQKFQTLHFDRQQVSQSADRFDTQHFRQGIKHFVGQAISHHQPKQGTK